MSADSGIIPADQRVSSIAPTLIGRWSRAAEFGLISFVLLVACGTLILRGGGLFDAYIMMGSPAAYPNIDNMVWAYSDGLGERAFHKENFYFVQHIVTLAGGSLANDMCFVRALYSLAASILIGPIGFLSSFILVNALCWAAAVALSYLFNLHISGSRFSGIIQAILTAVGSGFVFHFHDYSAHLMSFTFYYGGAYMFLVFEIWKRALTTRRLLIVICFLSLACLQYNSGVYLIAVFVIAGFGVQKFYQLVLASAIPIMVQRLWPHLVNYLYQAQTDYYGVESLYLARALESWRALLEFPERFIAVAVDHFLNFYFYDLPLAAFVLCGLGVAIFIPRTWRYRFPFRLILFLLTVIFIPGMLGLVWAPSAMARGYISYHSSIGLYFLASWLLLKLKGTFKSDKYGLSGAILAVFVVILSALWSFSHQWGAILPGKLYFFGSVGYAKEVLLEEILPQALTFKPTIESASDVCVGLPGVDTTYPLNHRCRMSSIVSDRLEMRDDSIRLPWSAETIFRSLIMRGFLLLPLIIIVISAWPLFNSLIITYAAVAIILCALIIPPFLIRFTQPQVLKVWYWHQNAAPSSLNEVHFRVKFKRELIDELSQLDADTHSIELMQGFGWSNSTYVTVRAADQIVLQKQTVGDGNRFIVDLPVKQFIEAILKNPILTIEVRGHITSFAGWQSNKLRGRKIIVPGQGDITSQMPAMPVFELRVREKKTWLAHQIWI